MSMNKNTESRTNKFSVGNLVKGRMIDYPNTGNKRSKYADIKWSNGTNSRIHLCHGTWDRIAVVG